MSVFLKACLLWCAILVFAVLNGMLREKVLIPLFGSFIALVVSGVLLAMCIFLVAWLAIPWWGWLPPKHWWSIGGLWLLLTLVFEFTFGRVGQHKSWAELMQAYTFEGGNLWPLVLLVILVSPRLAAHLRGLH